MKTKYQFQLAERSAAGHHTGAWQIMREIESLANAKRWFPRFRRLWKGEKTRLVKVTETIVPMPK